MLRLLRKYFEAWFGEPLRKVEAESLAYRLSDAGRGIDWKTPTVLVTAAACLVLQQYTSGPASVISAARFVATTLDGPAAAASVEETLRKWSNDPLSSRIWWALVSAFTYAVIPILVLKLGFGARLSDHGLKLHGVVKTWPLYVFFTLVMVPLVWFCSAEDRFQHTYPFMRFSSSEQVRADLWKWELAYAAQFVGLEFFFRGFMIHGVKHRFGAYSLFVPLVPYVLIHFGKPMPEATASIVAGVVLGFMSLATRSIWLGAALHIGVAWGMDCAVLYRRGLLS